MNADQLTFGVEFELYLPYSVVAGFGQVSYSRPIQVPGLPAGWVVKTDASLNRAPAGYTGIEIVSPVLKGQEGLVQVAQVARKLNEWGGKVNYTCGMHVHVGFDKSDSKTLGRLVALVARNELGLFASTGSRLRYEGRPGVQNYAKPIAKDSDYVALFKEKTSNGLPWDRYFSLNLATTKPTVEFRLFQGTCNPLKAVAYVSLCLGMVEKAYKAQRAAKWEQTAGHRRRKGDGANAMAWMFLELGWMSPKHHRNGLIEFEGSYSLDQIKAELYRLARKFDGPESDE